MGEDEGAVVPAGASAVIIYNNVAGAAQSITVAGPPNVTIPVVFRMPESPWPWDRREKSSQTEQAEPSLTPLDGGDLLLITGVLAITCALLVAVVWLARQPGRQSREI